MSGLTAAIGLLTRLPMPATRAEVLGTSVVWFPAVGALLGLFAALIYVALRLVLPSSAAAVLAVAALILATGALHEDGLADSADAWGGGTSTEETLRILRDPQHGTYGVVALVLSVLIRTAALAALEPASAVALLPAVHALSRGALVGLLAATPSARRDGLGSTYASGVSARQAAVALLVTVGLGVALVGLGSIPAVAIVAGIVWLVRGLAMRRIGGVTGDVLGATQQLGEMALLVVFASSGAADWMAR